MDLETLKEEVRARSDIVDVIGRYLKLQKAGPHYKGLCPFHQEKTPSFNVDSRKQAYYCFGCHAGGDVFNFIMDIEKVDFMSALERLAEQAGVPFDLDRGRGGPRGPSKERLYAIHEQIALWYESRLWEDPEGTEARSYVARRQLPEPMARKFRIGYAPDSFDLTLAHARKLGFTDAEIEASGIFGIREEARDGERFYDRFRGRLMFPIRDELARVIGFSGRVLRSEQSKAKYVNSPETLLFKKSRVLYGIDLARAPISSGRQALLCEGQLDVIRCHDAGLEIAVAAQGTAITEEHAHILKRFADEVILLLDSDQAGIKAALRSAEALLQRGLVVRVASLPPGEDPDSLVLSAGPEALRAVVRSAAPFLEFQIQTLLASEPELNEASRMRVMRAVVQTIGQAPEAVQREQMIQQAATLLGIRPEALRQDVRPVPPPAPAAPSGSFTAPQKPAAPRMNRLPSREDLALELLARHPDLILLARNFLKPKHLEGGEARELLAAMYTCDPPSHEGLQDVLRDHPLRGRFQELLMRRRTVETQEEALHPERGLEKMLLLLREDALKRRQHFLQGELETASADRRADLEMEIWQLTMVARKLREYRETGQWDAAATLLSLYD